MEEYIFQLLENNNRVIIPGFGAFIVKKRQPLLLVFNEFLQYNDGILIDLITKNENIDRDQAKIKVEEFIKKINECLDKGEAFPVQKLGFLVKTKSGKITLEEVETTPVDKTLAEEKEIALDQDKSISAKEPVPVKEKKQAAPDPAPATATAPVITPAPAPATASAPTPAPAPKEKPIEKKDKKIQTEITQPDEKRIKEPVVKENPVKQTPITNSRKIQDSSAGNDIKPEYQPLPNNRKYYLIWAIVLIVINGAIITYFFYNNKLSDLFPKNKNNTETILAEDTIKPLAEKNFLEDTTSIIEKPTSDIQQISKTEKPVVETASIPTGRRFYIVAGVFREEKNAQNFVKELKKKGYNSEQFGKIGATFAVSYNVYSSKDEAEKGLLKVKKETDPGAWIKVVE